VPLPAWAIWPASRRSARAEAFFHSAGNGGIVGGPCIAAAVKCARTIPRSFQNSQVPGEWSIPDT